MNRPLTKKEKQTKLNEARRRAILWSEREIRRRQLGTQAQIEAISLSASNNPVPQVLSQYSDVITPSSNENTVVSLQKTIQDLTIQRQELDITIRVLTNHLNTLLSQTKTSKGHKRSKHDG